MDPSEDSPAQAAAWIDAYRAAAPGADVLARSGDPAWSAMLEELAAVASNLAHARERVQRHAADIGTGFRIIGETDERPWPVSPVPLLIDTREWAGIEAGVMQRAALLETILADLYGPGRLVAEGLIPAALATGSPISCGPWSA
ncbi:hypothetical protein GCM10020258_24740 [Sphingomonas yabuuchiae]